MSEIKPIARSAVAKIWSLCNVLRGDGVSYHQYMSELSYLLFLKIAEENGSQNLLPSGYRWQDLVGYEGDNLLGHYQELLTHLGASARNKLVRQIYSFPTTVFSHSENLKVVIDGIDDLNWHSISQDGIGEIYEGLLAKNSEDARSGAGQYFTPRALVDCIIGLVKPELGEVIQDPATGTGGFLITADQYARSRNSEAAYRSNPPKYQGMEIERGTYRLCLMNTFLHRMKAEIHLGDALTKDVRVLDPADVVLANPPFGSKSGSARTGRATFSFQSSNKQLEFLQHIYQSLKVGGRAAVVLPDNVLFEEGTGRLIRRELMERCALHTILRLPTGIFYAQGVKTNVLFFTRGKTEKGNTKRTWFYDLRTNMPRFGKRNPLTVEYFSDFIRAFGSDPAGSSTRTEKGFDDRFRCLSRGEIGDRNDNLDYVWLKDSSFENDSDILDPEEIAAAIAANLIAASSELELLQAELARFSETE